MTKRAKRTGAQNKRFLTDVYNYMTDNGNKTAVEISEWYNTRELVYNSKLFADGSRQRTRHTTAKNTLSSIKVAGILSSSILFEKVDTTTQKYGAYSGQVGVWNIRSIEDILSRAVKSRKAPERFPKFIADELRRVNDE